MTMNDERIKEIVNNHYFGEGPTQLIETRFHKAIKQALAERDREIADWLDDKARSCGDNGFVEAAAFFHNAANELRNRKT